MQIIMNYAGTYERFFPSIYIYFFSFSGEELVLET